MILNLIPTQSIYQLKETWCVNFSNRTLGLQACIMNNIESNRKLYIYDFDSLICWSKGHHTRTLNDLKVQESANEQNVILLWTELQESETLPIFKDNEAKKEKTYLGIDRCFNFPYFHLISASVSDVVYVIVYEIFAC